MSRTSRRGRPAFCPRHEVLGEQRWTRGRRTVHRVTLPSVMPFPARSWRSSPSTGPKRCAERGHREVVFETGGEHSPRAIESDIVSVIGRPTTGARMTNAMVTCRAQAARPPATLISVLMCLCVPRTHAPYVLGHLLHGPLPTRSRRMWWSWWPGSTPRSGRTPGPGGEVGWGMSRGYAGRVGEFKTRAVYCWSCEVSVSTLFLGCAARGLGGWWTNSSSSGSTHRGLRTAVAGMTPPNLASEGLDRGAGGRTRPRLPRRRNWKFDRGA